MAFDNESKQKHKVIIKNEIKYNFSLSNEQKEAKQKILNSTINILLGKAGSGKSTLASNIALDLLFKKEIEKIIITRAMIVAGNEEIGFLPGGINDKLAPFTAPVYDCMNRIYKKEKIESLVVEGKIEVIPLAHIRGRNFSNCLIICDEAQNCSLHQFELLLTRLCRGSKIIFCGDQHQIDLKDKKQSGLSFFSKTIKDKGNEYSVTTLKDNHRHPIVDEIIEIFKELRD